MSNFINLAKAVETMASDASTANHPIRRMFIADGEHLSANVSILGAAENALHTQGSHDEIVVVIEGDADFRVGDETRKVGPGDLIFIPRNTIHGPIIENGQRFAALSVFAPYFDRSKTNIDWQKDE